MKKILLHLLVIVFACTSLRAASITADTTLPCVTTYEPNNTQETAVLIPLNTDIQAALYPSGDYDVYEINATTYAQLHITLHNPAANSMLSLYDSNFVEVIWHENPGVVDDSIDFITPGGKYYVCISTVGEPSKTCYTLNVRLTYPPLCPDTFEYNDILDSAKIITVGQPVAGRISDLVDRDYFKFTIDTPSNIFIYMNNVPLEDQQFDLLGANGIGLKSGIYDAANNSKHIFHYGAPAGTYYLATSSNGFAFNNECYQITVNTQPSQECADWYEPNNNDLEAPEIPVNTDIISKLLDRDFYLFLKPTGSSYFEVRADGLWENCALVVTDYYLQDVEFDHVGYNEDYASAEVFDAQTDYYIVEVRPSTHGPSNNCYKLRINVQGATARTGAPSNPAESNPPVKLYPVPTTGKVFMEITTTGENKKNITVSDLSGRVLFSQKYGVVDGLNKLEVTLPSSLPNGVYIISDGKQSRKILVRH